MTDGRNGIPQRSDAPAHASGEGGNQSVGQVQARQGRPVIPPRDVYEAAVRYLSENGWRRQELGSGWWWKDGCQEEATLGGALEQQLAADEIDQREAVDDEPAEFWG